MDLMTPSPRDILADAIHKAIVHEHFGEYEPHPAFLAPDSDQAAKGGRMADEVLPVVLRLIDDAVIDDRWRTWHQGARTALEGLTYVMEQDEIDDWVHDNNPWVAKAIERFGGLAP